MTEHAALDKNVLKVQALLEKVAQMTAQYENQVADLRVELTLAQQTLEELEKQAAEAQEAVKK